MNIGVCKCIYVEETSELYFDIVMQNVIYIYAVFIRIEPLYNNLAAFIPCIP